MEVNNELPNITNEISSTGAVSMAAYDRFGHLVCADCKFRLVTEAKKLSKFELIRPVRITQKFVGALCPKCKKKIIEELRRDNK